MSVRRALLVGLVLLIGLAVFRAANEPTASLMSQTWRSEGGGSECIPEGGECGGDYGKSYLGQSTGIFCCPGLRCINAVCMAPLNGGDSSDQSCIEQGGSCGEGFWQSCCSGLSCNGVFCDGGNTSSETSSEQSSSASSSASSASGGGGGGSEGSESSGPCTADLSGFVIRDPNPKIQVGKPFTFTLGGFNYGPCDIDSATLFATGPMDSENGKFFFNITHDDGEPINPGTNYVHAEFFSGGIYANGGSELTAVWRGQCGTQFNIRGLVIATRAPPDPNPSNNEYTITITVEDCPMSLSSGSQSSQGSQGSSASAGMCQDMLHLAMTTAGLNGRLMHLNADGTVTSDVAVSGEFAGGAMAADSEGRVFALQEELDSSIHLVGIFPYGSTYDVATLPNELGGKLTNSMAFDTNDDLYVLNDNKKTLYRIDVLSGQVVPLHIFAENEMNIVGGDMVFESENVFLYVSASGTVYRVNMTTWQVTALGTVSNVQFTSAMLDDGILYAIDQSSNALIRINLSPFGAVQVNTDGRFSYGDGGNCPQAAQPASSGGSSGGSQGSSASQSAASASSTGSNPSMGSSVSSGSAGSTSSNPSAGSVSSAGSVGSAGSTASNLSAGSTASTGSIGSGISNGSAGSTGSTGSNGSKSSGRLLGFATLCGNGIPESGEECDDGNTVNTDGCSNACTLPGCGDGVTAADEQCDDGPYNADIADTCRRNCRLPACGDGIVDGDEVCDDGNRDGDDACTNACRLAELEACVSDDDCATDLCGEGVCVAKDYCGNGVREDGEWCDDPFDARCTSACTWADGAPCGGNEECGSGLCASGTCAPPRICGNGVKDPGEECDQGEANSNTIANRCRLNCGLARLGDGVIDNGEECDDGNALGGDGCTPEGVVEAVAGSETLDAAITAMLDSGPQTAPQVFAPQTLPAALLAAPLPVSFVGGVLDAQHAAAPETGPAAVLLMVSGAAAGAAWIRRRR